MGGGDPSWLWVKGPAGILQMDMSLEQPEPGKMFAVVCVTLGACMMQTCLDWVELERSLLGVQRGFLGGKSCLQGPLGFPKHGGEHAALKAAGKTMAESGSAHCARGSTQHPAEQRRSGLQAKQPL